MAPKAMVYMCSPSVVVQLLQKDPEKRLGGGEEDAQEVKRHHFFRVIIHEVACFNNWTQVQTQALP